ncbi:MAG TPA: hypothetical protein DIU39_07840 [Flavobacteriales bacterium]|nr:hypothetical protein [Flavobacteriales bacterium]
MNPQKKYTMAYFTNDFFDFFKQLAPNNNREWFHAHKNDYETYVKIPTQNFVDSVLRKLESTDNRFAQLTYKDCMFRINRDIRLSKDKSPYKLHIGIIFSPVGKKYKEYPGLYVELNPEHIRIYGGIYSPDRITLEKIRNLLIKHPKKFKSIIENDEFQSVYGEILGAKNKRLPKEMMEAANKQPLLFNKQLYFYNELPVDDALKDDFDQTIVNHYKIALPFFQFFEKAFKN